jgi:hypothetical protein
MNERRGVGWRAKVIPDFVFSGSLKRREKQSHLGSFQG